MKSDEILFLTAIIKLTLVPETYRFQYKEQLWVAENDGGERDREAEAEEEHHIALIVKLVVSCVPVRSTGALHALRDIPGETDTESVL